MSPSVTFQAMLRAKHACYPVESDCSLSVMEDFVSESVAREVSDLVDDQLTFRVADMPMMPFSARWDAR